MRLAARFACLIPFFAISATASASEPSVGVLDFAEEAKPDAWISARVSDLVAYRLSVLGISVRDRRFARHTDDPRSFGLDALVAGRVRPIDVEREDDALTIDLEVRAPPSPMRRLRATGRAKEIDRMTADLAIQIGLVVGVDGASFRSLVEQMGAQPFAVHQFLGRAERRLEAGEALQATFLFDRAGSFADRGAVPEAIEGRARAEGAHVALRDAAFGSRSDLAVSARERAIVAIRDSQWDVARKALVDLAKYTSVRARRWTVPISFEGDDRLVVVGQDKRWLVQTGKGPFGLLEIHPPTGTVVSFGAGRAGLVGEIGGHHLVLESRALSRIDPDRGTTLWKVTIPLAPVEGRDRVLFSEGSMGVLSRSGVAWVELGLGALGQVATDVRPLAAGGAGVLVAIEGGVALLRPGKKTPAWKTNITAVDHAAMTPDRAAVFGGGTLSILATYNGQIAKSLPAPEGGVILAADARLLCFGTGHAAHVYDLLSAEKIAEVTGPGRAIDCHSEPDGVAVLYDTADLLYFDREGRLVDRARVSGRPEGILRNSPIAPGPVVVTDRGLVAFAEAGGEALQRDVDVMLRLAEIEADHGRSEVALRLADHIAVVSAGSVAKAEMLRAKLLRSSPNPVHQRAADLATMRCRAAEQPSLSLPPLALADQKPMK